MQVANGTTPLPANGNEPACRLHEVPLSALLAHADAPRWMSEDWDRYVRDGWRALEHHATAAGLAAMAVPCCVDGYLATVHGHAGSGCVCLFDASTRAPVGGVFDGNLHVYPGHQGRGLAAEAMRLAFEGGIKRVGDHVLLSEGGRATRRAAHRKAVWDALASGISVAPGIVAEHPDLADGIRAAASGERT